MEDDKLDFGDLDDFDTQQDGLLDQTGSFTNNIEDLAALERELGIDDFAESNTQSTLTTESKKPSLSPNRDNNSSLTSSKPVVTASSNKNSHTPPDNTADPSSSSNTRPSMARNKHEYHNKAHRYNPYQQQQQQQYPAIPYQGFFPMSGGLPYGQGFINMPMHGGMMGLPMMGYNSMSTGSPQNRRIHVNPKFAGARPPMASQSPQTNGTRNQQPSSLYRAQADQGRHQRPTPADDNQMDRHQRNPTTPNHGRQEERKRQREYDEHSPHQESNASSPQHSEQPSQRRRLDIQLSSSPATTYQSSSPQSSIVSKGNYGKPNHQHSPSAKRDIQPSTVSRPNNGISIRGAASAAASSGFTNSQTISANYTRDRHLSSPPTNQRLSSPVRPTTENISRGGSSNSTNGHNTKQYASANDKNGMKSSILQRLGGKNSKNNNEVTSGRDRTNAMSNSNDAPALQFANGKSSKLIISNISPSVTESDLIALEPKSVKNVSLTRQDNKATLLFAGIDPAVNFRRKYNRTMIGGQHISIAFAKS